MSNLSYDTALRILNKLVVGGKLKQVSDYSWRSVNPGILRIDIKFINGFFFSSYMEDPAKYKIQATSISIYFESLSDIKHVRYNESKIKTAFRSKIMRELNKIN